MTHTEWTCTPLIYDDLVDATFTLVKHVHNWSESCGWWTDISNGNPLKDSPRIVQEKLCLIHSEISEALEGYRKNLMDDKLPTRPMIEVELADALIRIVDLAGGMGYDLAGAVADKMRYNSIRADHKITHRASDNGKKF